MEEVVQSFHLAMAQTDASDTRRNAKNGQSALVGLLLSRRAGGEAPWWQWETAVLAEWKGKVGVFFEKVMESIDFQVVWSGNISHPFPVLGAGKATPYPFRVVFA